MSYKLNSITLYLKFFDKFPTVVTDSLLLYECNIHRLLQFYFINVMYQYEDDNDGNSNDKLLNKNDYTCVHAEQRNMVTYAFESILPISMIYELYMCDDDSCSFCFPR